MKKILTAFFLSVALMFAGLLCLNVNAAEKAIYSTGFEDATTGTNFQGTVSQTFNNVEWKIYYGNFTTTDAISGNSAQIRLYSTSKNCGYLTNINSFQKVSKIKFNYKVSNKNTKFKVSWTDGTNSDSELVTPSSTSSTNYEKKFDTLIDNFILKIEVDSTSTFPESKHYKFTIDDIFVYTEEETSTYSISFDANGGTFVEGQGTAIENIPNGTEKTVTLPTAADLSSPAYKYSVFKSWTDGKNTYAPGEEVKVTAETTFTAVYEAPEFITVSQALEICKITGTSNTSIEFSVKGVVSKIRYAYSSSTNCISVNLSDETSFIYLYKMKGGADLTVGDEIIATGYLITYNNTPEMNEGCTYVKGECANFIETDTKSSLIVTYDEELNPTDVDLRLGGIITTDSYLAGATYGVLVTTGTVNLTAGKTTYATVAEFIAANKGFKNVTCTPAQVATGYQFAWVITDMEDNYNTSLTAVMYMVYDGALYICNSKTTSVKDTASQYITDAVKLGLTEEQVTVLEKLVA